MVNRIRNKINSQNIDQNTQFETLYKRLNPAQKQAVDTIEGPVMVIAGPGTGKTSILTLRIANILKNTDTPANGILAITYTDAGVKAMRMKLQAIIGNRAHDIRIHTFHSFASAIISEHPDHFLHLQEMNQITDIEQESIIRKILEEKKFRDIRPMAKPDAYLISILKSIDDSKRNALTSEMVFEHAEDEIKRIKEDEDSISTRGITKGRLKASALEKIEKCERTKLFSEVYTKYEEEKKNQKKLDFNDLIVELLSALRDDELLLRLVQEQFLYIHIDEHQDTNDAQNSIIKIIAEFFETPNIFIVGDEKQAIYRFQGASVENFLLLQKRWPEMKIISLDINYRSHQTILDASFGMIENNYKEKENNNLLIKLKSNDNLDANLIDVLVGENIQATEKYLVDSLKEIIKKEPRATVAIITRRNRELDRVLRILESQSIPVSSERNVDIFKHPIGILFFNIIEYISDNTRFDLLARTLISGMWNLSFEKSIQIIRLLKSGQNIDFDNELPGLVFLHRKLLNDNPIEFIINCANESGFIKLISKDPTYIHIWRSIISLSETLIRGNNIKDPMNLIMNLIAYRISSESRIIKISIGSSELPFQALTAHGSKGLEFDYVFIPYATEEAWIGRNRGNSFLLPNRNTDENSIDDIRRLFYVAMTRAKKHLSILTHMEEFDGKKLTELRFISELNTSLINNRVLSKIDTDFTINRKENGHANQIIEDLFTENITNLAKETILKHGLSITALNHFIKCPNEFIYKSILKLPQAPNVSSEKGNAMHIAFSRIWNSKSRKIKDIEKIIKESVNEYLEKSLLSIKEKDSIRNELLENAPIIAKAMESHFSIQYPVFTEHWIEINFNVNFLKENINFTLHGKLDAIIDTTNEVLVFDYKTKKCMSQAEIKGETKNSDGSYFRQLIFYKMLLDNHSKWRGRNIRPALAFISPDDNDKCPISELTISERDLEAVRANILILIETIWNKKITKGKCGVDDCEWCKMRRL